MAKKTRQILIESILGGQSPMTHFAGADQFKASLGIDPALPAVDNNDTLFKESGIASSGLIRPASYAWLADINNTTMMATPMWLIQNPKNSLTYVYDALGSVYSIGNDYYASFSALGDMGDTGGSIGNGGAYYDNYIYFATNTTIARYGPLNGTPAFIDDYWVTTLSKTALENTTYPQVTTQGTGNYSLDLDNSLSEYAYILGANQQNLGITGDMSIESYVNFRDLPSTSQKMGLVSIAKRPSSFGNNYSADLEGSSTQYFTATDSASLSITSDLTIEAWIKLESLDAVNNTPVFFKSNGTGDQRSYAVSLTPAGSVQVSISSAGTSGSTIETTIAGGFTTGSWQHLAVVYTASLGKVEIFKNGVLAGSATSFPTSIYNGTATFAVGNDSTGGSSGKFDGMIDDIRIWNTTKTSTQILANMSNELNGSESNLQAYWKLNNALTDSTTNANTLTNVNSVTFTTTVPFGGWQAYWKLDNSLADSVGSRTLTNTGGASFVSGILNSCVVTTSTSQYLGRSAETIGVDNEWSISAWVKFNDVTEGGVDFVKWNGSVGDENRIVLSTYATGGVGTGTGRLRVVIVDSAGVNYKDYNVSGTTFANSTWYHVVVTYNGTLNAYINGVSQSFNKELDSGVTMTDSTRILTIGGDNTTVYVDEVGYTNRVLSSTEITQLYNSGNAYSFSSDAVTTYNVYFDNSAGTQRINIEHLNSTSQTESVSVDWSPSAGTWYHTAVTIAGSTVAFYVNGVAQGATGTFSYTRSPHTSADFRVGSTPLTETFDGYIDETRIWNDNISSADILANMSMEISGATTSLVSYWKFNNDYQDENTNNNDLTGSNSDPIFSSRVPFGLSSIRYPNHVMHRHSDGKLYVADVVGNQGVLHVISTTKTTVEGDTDSNSTYNAIDFGYGLYPTAIESYGSSIVVALYEGSDGGTRAQTAKLAFWDTTSNNFNSIIFKEFPDSIITALKNINGTLYIVSTNSLGQGFRLSHIVGGYTIQEDVYNEFGQAPLAGGVDGTANRILFGSATQVPNQSACAFSYGLQKGSLGQGLFNIASFENGAMATALILPNMSTETGESNSGFGFYTPMVGWSGASTVGEVSVIKRNADYNTQIWWSQMYRIGQPFRITKIRIPLATAVIDGVAIIPKIYMDGGANVFTLKEINYTNNPGEYNILRRADQNGATLSGQNNFFLALEWNGTILSTVSLPILIEYETTDD